MTAARLRLVSWNLHGVATAPRITDRMASAASELVRRAPRVALLQEVWRDEDARLLEDRLRPLGYVPVPVPEGGLFGRTAGLLTLVRASEGFAFEDAGFEPYAESAPAWRFWEGDGLGHKGVQWLRLRGPGVDVWMMNTHLQATYAGRRYTAVRRSQLRQMTARAAALAERATLPVLLAGDLNTTPDEAAYAEIASNWQDLCAGLRETCDCPTVPDGPPDAWIDYVLARVPGGRRLRAELELIRNRARDDPYSDHQGLQADVELPSLQAARLPLLALALGAAGREATRRAWLATLGLGVGELLLPGAQSRPRSRCQ